MIKINEDISGNIEYVYNSLGNAKKYFSFFSLHHGGKAVSTSINKLDPLYPNQYNNGKKASIMCFEMHNKTIIFFFDMMITEDHATSKKVAQKAFSILNKVNKTFYDLISLEFDDKSPYYEIYRVKGRADIKDLPTLNRFIKMASELIIYVTTNFKGSSSKVKVKRL